MPQQTDWFWKMLNLSRRIILRALSVTPDTDDNDFILIDLVKKAGLFVNHCPS